jgi:hypothetical protein
VYNGAGRDSQNGNLRLTENPGEGQNLLRQLVVERIALLPGENENRFYHVGTIQLSAVRPNAQRAEHLPGMNGFIKTRFLVDTH